MSSVVSGYMINTDWRLLEQSYSDFFNLANQPAKTTVAPQKLMAWKAFAKLFILQ